MKIEEKRQKNLNSKYAPKNFFFCKNFIFSWNFRHFSSLIFNYLLKNFTFKIWLFAKNLNRYRELDHNVMKIKNHHNKNLDIFALFSKYTGWKGTLSTFFKDYTLKKKLLHETPSISIIAWNQLYICYHIDYWGSINFA